MAQNSQIWEAKKILNFSTSQKSSLNFPANGQSVTYSKSKTVHVGDPAYTYELILDQISQCQNMLNIQHGQFFGHVFAIFRCLIGS